MIIKPSDAKLQYTGRIDFDNPDAPVLVYAASSVKLCFVGTSVKVKLANHKNYGNGEVGYFIDGAMKKIKLREDSEPEWYTLEENLKGTKHELLLYKRQDGCHYVTFFGFELNDGAIVDECPAKPTRKMEVFGDSVSCGEVSEAMDNVGQSDPENHEGKYSNSWYSYSWMTARRLGAELHISSQGGLALMDKTGWFAWPDFVGAESTYDKIEYNPQITIDGVTSKPWNFENYTPNLVVIAIGQNDANPEDYMKEDYDGEKAINWRNHYKAFVENLMNIYPKATFVLATTVLMHDLNWDKAIGEVCDQLASPRVHHFMYNRTAAATPGHIRIPEAEEMCNELAGFVESLGDSVWE